MGIYADFKLFLVFPSIFSYELSLNFTLDKIIIYVI